MHEKNEIRERKMGFAVWESFLVHLEYDDFSKCSLKPIDDITNDINGVNSLD
jgi:hypothetical protein